MTFFATLIVFILIRRTDTQSTTCTGSTYSYGSTSCSSCPPGATIVTGNARGCTPSSTLTPGPIDSLVFYLSGTSTEGASAFPNAPTVSYVTSPFGESNGALTLSSGSSLSLTPSVGSGLLSVLPSDNSAWSASAWVKCAAPMTRASFFEWGVTGSTLGRFSLGETGSQQLGVRYVRITNMFYQSYILNGVDFSGTFNFGEIKIFSSNGDNVALNRPASMSTIDTANTPGGAASAVDGNPTTYITTSPGTSQWWQVDLGSPRTDLSSISFYIRNGNDGWGTQWAYRANSALVSFYDASLNIIANYALPSNVNVLPIPFTFSLQNVLPSFPTLPNCDSKWHHLTVTHGDGSATNSKLYLDGAFVSTTSETLAIPMDGSSSLVIGSMATNNNNAQNPFSSSLSDLRIYSRALTDSEVLSLSQPVLSTNVNVVAPSPIAGATSYSFPCSIGFYGATTTLTRSNVDYSWSWSGGITPLCAPCPSFSSTQTSGSTSLSSCTLCQAGYSGASVTNGAGCAACSGSTYSYGGSSSCSSCPTGATIVTGNSRGCTPSSTLTPGPSDSLVFYLSGTSTEGVSAFPNAPTVSYVSSPFGDVNGALTLSSGSSLSLTPSVGSGLLSVLPSGNSAWSASAWVKCGPSSIMLPFTGAALYTGTKILGSVSLSVDQVFSLFPGFSNAWGVVVDSLGNVFVSDFSNNAVKKTTPSGITTTFISEVTNPTGLAFDSTGTLFVSSYGGTVKKFPLGQPSQVVASGLRRPYLMTFDSSGNLYVAEFVGNAVTIISPYGDKREIGGLNGPVGVAVDTDNNLYIGDCNANVVKKVSSVGQTISTWSGFNCPQGIAVDNTGNMFVVDTNNNAVKKLSSSGTLLKTWTGFIAPQAVALDSWGNILVTTYQSNSITVIFQSRSPCDSKWHHFAITHGDGAPSVSKTYVDGALVSTAYQTFSLPSDGTNLFIIGSVPLSTSVSGSYSFTGSPGVSTCPAGVSSFVSSSLPCAPITGPTDTSFYLSCDETEGTGAYSVTNPLGITFVADRFGTPGRALQLNDAYFATPVSMPLSVGNAPRSVALFVKCIALAGDYTPIIWWGASSNNAASGLSMLNANTMHWSFWSNDVYCPNCWTCDGLWHHWASTFDGTKVTVYLDSVVKISETKSTNTASGTTLKIGREPNFGGVFNKNTGFDDIRIYNRALSATEIADIYNNARTSFHDIRIYNRALTSSEVLTLSLPPFSALGVATNAVLSSNPSSVATSYAFSCASNTRGIGGTFTQSSIDRSWSWSPRPLCDYCPPGTYLPAGAFSCSLCPSGYYGNRAGLTSPTCSGPCPVPSECPAGTAYPPSSLSTLSCASGGARAIPSTLGMRLWPAAHPKNPQKVDLIVAPLNVCEAHTQQSCLQRSSVSMGGVTLYTVGTASDLHMEPADDLTCLVQ